MICFNHILDLRCEEWNNENETMTVNCSYIEDQFYCSECWNQEQLNAGKIQCHSETRFSFNYSNCITSNKYYYFSWPNLKLACSDPNEIPCFDGKCISLFSICDEKIDCTGELGEDEQVCGSNEGSGNEGSRSDESSGDEP